MEPPQVPETALETQDDDVLGEKPIIDGYAGASQDTPVSTEPPRDVGKVSKTPDPELRPRASGHAVQGCSTCARDSACEHNTQPTCDPNSAGS